MNETIESPATRIILTRHGETEWNRTQRFQGRSDIPLNKNGRDQAHALAMALKDESLTAIYSSPLVRATETARIIKTFHPETPLCKEDDLIEMDLGDFEGMEAREWLKQYPDFREIWEKDPGSVKMPGGENLQGVQERAVGALERIAEGHSKSSTLLISSHNFVNITILCFALGTPFEKFRDLRQETAALNILYKHGKRFRVDVVNEQSHLLKYTGQPS